MVSAVKVRVVHRPQLTEGPWRNEFQRRARRVRRGAAATARPAQQAGGFATAVAAARPSAVSARSELYVVSDTAPQSLHRY